MEYCINSSYKKGWCHLAGKRRYYPRGCTLIFSIYIGWADFLGSKVSISISFGGFQQKQHFFWLEIFVDIFWGSLLNLIIFMGYLRKSTTVICVL